VISPLSREVPTSIVSRMPRLGRQIALTAGALCVSELAAGAYFGFASLSAHVAFWALGTTLVIAAFLIADGLFPSPDFADTSIRTGILAFALVVLCGLVFGATRLVARTPYVAAEALVLCSGLSSRRRAGCL
jgi:hypothetical protein